jgi:hypothetical protein
MDLKVYYRKIREQERRIEGDSVVVVSNETPDGGKAGVMTEVPRATAARMLVDDRAKLASDDEVKEFLERKAEAHRAHEQLVAANRMQITVVPAGVAGSRPIGKVTREQT